MSDDDRLRRVLARARALEEPATACPAHAPVVARLQDDSVDLDEDAVDALAEIPDCPACRAAVRAHPRLSLDALDLPLPPPRLDEAWIVEDLPAADAPAAEDSPPADDALDRTPAGSRTWLLVVGALAIAALVLVAVVPMIGATVDEEPPRELADQGADPRPGPRTVGRTGYTHVDRPGPRVAGQSGYAWVPPVPSSPAYPRPEPVPEEAPMVFNGAYRW